MIDMATGLLIGLGYLLWKGGGIKPSGKTPAQQPPGTATTPAQAGWPKSVITRPMTEAEKKAYPTMTPQQKAAYGGYAPGQERWTGTDEEALLQQARAKKKKGKA